MACPPSKAKFQLRRDTAANWTGTNPLILEGEPGVEIDTNKLKIGDGKKRWVDLPYIGGDSPLVFTPYGNVRRLTGYKENNKTLTVRSADLNGNMFNINLASFTPGLSVVALPSNSLLWDDKSTAFTVSITNPSDFTTEYVDEVKAIVASSGTVSSLDRFTAGVKGPTPAGGVNWSQTFTTNNTAVIQSPSTTISGGSVSASISFRYKDGTKTADHNQTIPLNISWATPTISLAVSSMSGKTFLETYTSTSYSLSVTGIRNSAVYAHSVTATGGTVTNPNGNGTFTFSEPIHKDNIIITRRVSNTTTFTRPSYVTGTQYSAQLTTGDSARASFRYPSFWIFTSATSNPPSLSSVINGNAFSINVNLLGDRASGISDFISNNTGGPLAFWFAVFAGVSPATSFKTGASPSLLSDVAVVRGRTINIEPANKPAGYNSVTYVLYGITLQSGSTYVSIT